MKVCLNIDGIFKLFEIVVLANFHDKYSQKSKKEIVIFSSFFCFWRKKPWHERLFMTPCIKYLNIMGFIQRKLKEFQFLSFLENSLC